LFDRRKDNFRRILLSDNTGTDYITSITEDRGGQIWVSTLKGLKMVDLDSFRLLTIPALRQSPALYEGKTWSAFQDQDHSIWIGMNSGLGRMDARTKKIKPLPAVLAKNSG